MARNHIVGKNKRKGSNKATGRDYSYDKAYESRPERLSVVHPEIALEGV